MSIYPNYTAGQRLTAADLIAGQFLVVTKTVSTDRTSTTTFADDPDLSFDLVANSVYTIEFYMSYAGNAGLMSTKWTVPDGATGNRTAMGPGSDATDSQADNMENHSGVHGYSTVVTYGNRLGSTGSSLNQSFALETSLITVTTAGTCAVSWTQGTSNSNATRMAAGSWARALRIS